MELLIIYHSLAIHLGYILPMYLFLYLNNIYYSLFHFLIDLLDVHYHLHHSNEYLRLYFDDIRHQMSKDDYHLIAQYFYLLCPKAYKWIYPNHILDTLNPKYFPLVLENYCDNYINYFLYPIYYKKS